MSDIDRFHTRYVVEPNTGCWLWTGCTAKSSNGYGKFSVDGVIVYAHRAAWLLLRGRIPRGKVLDHTCRTRACCNPDHLEPVSVRVNTLRGVGPTARNAAKDACPQGHEYSAANTVIRRGRRHCAACEVARRAA